MESIQPYIDWLGAHPTVALLTVFMISFLESLAVFGLLMPGAVLLFAMGSLVGLGVLQLMPMLIVGSLGAVLGDGISYFFGRYFHGEIKTFWPFNKHPQWLERGQAYFVSHGGKSIFLARFIGPLRPFMPMVAGMMDMPVQRYALISVISAILWSPAYILPGVIWGASLTMSENQVGRIMIYVVTAIIAIGVSLKVLAWGWQRLAMSLARGLEKLRVPALTAPWVASPELMLVVLLALIASFALMLGMEPGMGVTAQPFKTLNYWAMNFFGRERLPILDHWMLLLTQLGDEEVLIWVAGVFAAAFWLLKEYRASIYYLLGVGAVFISNVVLKNYYDVVRPERWLPLDGYSFPSGHAMNATVVFGLAAMLMASKWPVVYQKAVGGCIALVVLLIAASRVYLQAHWLTDVLAGMSLGLLVSGIFGVLFYANVSSNEQPIKPWAWLWLGLAVVLVLTGYSIVAWPGNIQRYFGSI